MLKFTNRYTTDKALEFLYHNTTDAEVHKNLRSIQEYIQSQDRLLDYYRGKIEGMEYAIENITAES